MYWRFPHLLLTDDINFCFMPYVYNSCPHHHYNRSFILSIYSFCLFIHSFCLSIHLLIYLFIYFVYLFIYLFIYSFILFIYSFIYLFIFFNAEKFHQTLARLESQHAQFMGRSGKPLSSSKNKAQHQYKYMTPDVLKHFFGKVEILELRNFEMFIYWYFIFLKRICHFFFYFFIFFFTDRKMSFLMFK